MTRRIHLPLAGAVLLCAAGPASAHVSSTGLARIEVRDRLVSYRLTLVLGDLPERPRRLLALAADGDAASARQIADAVGTCVELSRGGEPCRPGRVAIRGSGLGDGRIDLELAARCARDAGPLGIRDRWASFLGEHHRTLARVDAEAGTRELVFSAGSEEASVPLGEGGRAGAAGFFGMGVEHILSGWDHLLFLAVLLLGGGNLLSLVRVVTAFSLAHSITLALAVLGIAVVPSRLVEPAIAASIVWVAVENLRARGGPPRRALMSLAFGLLHGFGFASALRELSLPAGRLAWALVGFNLGVEAGQALVLLAAFPVLLRLRRAAWEPSLVRAGSAAVGLVGSALLVQRIFSVS